jgi:hypothetical protein
MLDFQPLFFVNIHKRAGKPERNALAVAQSFAKSAVITIFPVIMH